jgi:hypothetical protein
MALTMTRTRTQTALTKLVTLAANVHGELAFVEEHLQALLGGSTRARGLPRSTADREQVREALQHRRQELLTTRDALYLTLKQFDPALEPKCIGETQDWLRPFGRGLAAKRRYLAAQTDTHAAGCN